MIRRRRAAPDFISVRINAISDPGVARCAPGSPDVRRDQ
jgi:hypothetical protein